MYEFAAGPLFLFSVLAFFAGLVFRGWKLYSMTEKQDGDFLSQQLPAGYAAEYNLNWRQVLREKRKILMERFGADMFLAVLSSVFHFFLFFIPLTLAGHNVIFFQSWRITLPCVTENISDFLTCLFFISAFLLMMRRLLLPRVRAITGIYNYFLFFITVLPFITGFMAYHQFYDYPVVLVLHVLSGDLLLIMAGWTKLGHMVFFLFGRFFIGNEFTLGRGMRAWQ